VAGVVLKLRNPRRGRFKTVVANVFRYVFRGAARSWARNMSGTAPALGSMTLLLLISGLVGVSGFALYNLEQVEATQASLLHVYLRDEASITDVYALLGELSRDPRVADVTYVSKDAALKRAQQMPGLPQIADSSDSNPFPASLDVQVKSIDDVAAIDAFVHNRSVVDPVYPTSYDRGAYQRIQNVLFGVAVAGIAFLVMLGFVAITVTVNSIKAAIHARRDEIRIMQLVGAPRWMVRSPFVVEGAITGVIAGSVAGLVTFGLTLAAIANAGGAFKQFAPGVTGTVSAVAACVVLLAGFLLGSGSSLISLRRHLET
jgi:cell division protein FtsX